MPDDPLSMTPLPHQEQLSDKLEDSAGQVAFHGIGSGKTLTAINAAHQHDLPLLAIVPAALRNNMRKEIERSGFKNPYQVVSYQEALNRINDPDFKEFAANSLTAYDEAHRAGSATSDRKRLFSELPAQKRLLLTATPFRNSPSEIGPLINAVSPGALPDDERGFSARFLEKRETPVGFWGALTGQRGAVQTTPKNLHEFEKAVRGKVDFYQSANRADYPSSTESVVEVPMSQKQQAAYDFVSGKYPVLAYKIKHGIPPSKAEASNFQAFMSGPRQVVNHPGPFNASATDADAAKIQVAVNEIDKRKRSDKNYRGVAYSAFLGTGIHPMSRELDRRGIAHATFTGEQGDTERRKIVEDYNKGKTPVLLISGAGAEGLDLKGTKHMAILEPHWHEEMIDQIRGRAIRYKSHAHLPEAERHVEVQRFHAVPQPSWTERLLGRKRGGDLSADEYLYQHALKKRKINEPFMRILRGESADEVEAGPPGLKVAEALLSEEPSLMVTAMNTRHPALLLDIDETLVTWPGGFGSKQILLPGRIEALQKFKALGYLLIGITNRSDWDGKGGVLTLMEMNRYTQELLGGLLDDIFFCPVPSESLQKPSPTMLLAAIAAHRVDMNNTVMVGDSEDDKNAAAAAGVPYVHGDRFFAAVQEGLPAAEGRPEVQSPKWTQTETDLEGTLVTDDPDALMRQIEAECQQHDLPAPVMTADGNAVRVRVPLEHPEIAAYCDEHG